jgi:hypothetical protein
MLRLNIVTLKGSQIDCLCWQPIWFAARWLSSHNRRRSGRQPIARMGGGAAALAGDLGHHPFGAQARTTFTETPCRCGRNVALLSASKTKLPPGLIA